MISVCRLLSDRESSHSIHSSYEIILIRENNFKIGSVYRKKEKERIIKTIRIRKRKNLYISIYIRVKENLFLSEKFPFIPPFPNFIPPIKSFLPPTEKYPQMNELRKSRIPFTFLLSNRNFTSLDIKPFLREFHAIHSNREER